MMLNHQKLAKKLDEIGHTIFIDTSHEKEIARKSWQRLVSDVQLKEKLHAIDAPWLIPSWSGSLDTTRSIKPYNKPYSALAVDGSQVYPDRHEGVSCFLINIGVAQITYGIPFPVVFSSDPMVFSGFDADDYELESSHDLVNCMRQEFELHCAVKACEQTKEALKNTELLFLCDGSLIFWHLESKGPYLRDRFLDNYLASLQQLYLTNTLNAGYISLPKSKELVNLIRLELCSFEPKECVAHKKVRHIIDSSITHFFLKKYERTTVFKSTASICAYYPDHLKPYFFYMHVGFEIARVEVPSWIAINEDRVDKVAAMMLDQVTKGRGYPIALAESHEQAVVKAADREFFYMMLSKLSIDAKKNRVISQKSAKKRGMGI